jgi:transcriptional regulator with XRE-family HTH domain
VLTLALRPRQGLLWDGMSEANTPFITLGSHLKYVREQSRQSLIEVSGAVEIDEQRLERIEAGIERPAEDILLLLISHFGVADREAVQLWELADYDSDMPDQIKPDSSPDAAQFTAKNVVMLVGFDTRTIYSDGLDVIWNKSGMTLNFTQATGKPQDLSVARVGMSYEQAEQVLQTLQKAVLRAKYVGDTKLLPASTETQA